MDNLNFLYQKPSTNWLDFFLDPENFAKFIEIGRNFDELLSEFCQQALKEEQTSNKIEIENPEKKRYHLSKCCKLWLYALTVLAKTGWDIATLVRKRPFAPFHHLLHRFLIWTCGKSPTHADRPHELLTEIFNYLSWQELDDIQKFGIWIFTRWCILVEIRSHYPVIPPRSTTSNIQAQASKGEDPDSSSKIDADCLLHIRNDLLVPSVAIQQRWLKEYPVTLTAPVAVPSYTNFSQFLQDNRENEIEPGDLVFKVKVKPVASVDLHGQVLYTLGEYFFSLEDYEGSKKCFQSLNSIVEKLNPESPIQINRPKLAGYSKALKLERLTEDQNQDIDMRVVTTTPTTQSEDLLYLSSFKDDTSDILKRIFTHIKRELPVPKKLLQNFQSNSQIALLVETLTANQSSLDPHLLEAYLIIFALNMPKFSDQLQKSNLNERFKNSVKIVDRESQETCPIEELNMQGNIHSTPYWQILTSFDPVVLKQALTKRNALFGGDFVLPFRLSSPPTMDHLISQCPQGLMRDYAALVIAKATQLTNNGEVYRHEQLLAGLRFELDPTLSNPNIQTAINEEVFRAKLDEDCRQRFSASGSGPTMISEQIISTLEGILNSTPNVQVIISLCAFLLNSGKWDYLVGDKCQNIKHRFIDFSRLLAALCQLFTSPESDHDDTRKKLCQVAEYFHSYTQSTLSNKPPDQKKSLLDQSQLSLLLEKIAEPSLLSLLVSYFASIYNAHHNGLKVLLVLKNYDLWPQQSVEKLSEDYLMQMMSLCSDNGLRVDPVNPFFLIMKAEYLFVVEHFTDAIKNYLNALYYSSDGFEKPISVELFGDKTLQNMSKCFTQMRCFAEAALICQLMCEPGEVYPSVTRPFSTLELGNDSLQSYASVIWDIDLFEFLIANCDQNKILTRILQKALSFPDLNQNNRPEILEKAKLRRRRNFLSILTSKYT